jgi:shikimate kinase
MNIFLIGFMGSGKSTIGKKLANRLGYTFLDMDREIESEQQKSIAQIFKEQGENYFRALESDWLKKFNQPQTVISTGGGTPCFHNNIEIMKSKGKTVFLDVSPEVLSNRLFNAKQARPLLENYIHNQENLKNYIAQKLSERLPVYQLSDIQLNVADFNSQKLDELVNAVQK